MKVVQCPRPDTVEFDDLRSLHPESVDQSYEKAGVGFDDDERPADEVVFVLSLGVSEEKLGPAGLGDFVAAVSVNF